MISITLPEKKAFEYLATEVASYMVIKDHENKELFLCHLKEFNIKPDGGVDAIVTQIDAGKDDEILNEYFCSQQKMDNAEEDKADYLYFDKDRFAGKEDDKDAIKELNYVVKYLCNCMANAAVSIEKTMEMSNLFDV